MREYLTYPQRVVIRRLSEQVREFLKTLSQLQMTPTEELFTEDMQDMFAYLDALLVRGYYINSTIHTVWTRTLDGVVDTVIPAYKEGTFRVYMHPNGSFRREWRDKLVNGVLPLSARTDGVTEMDRVEIQQRTEAAYVQQSQLKS